MSKNIMRFILCLAVLWLNLHSSLDDGYRGGYKLVGAILKDAMDGVATLKLDIIEGDAKEGPVKEAEQAGIQKLDDTQGGSEKIEEEPTKRKHVDTEADEKEAELMGHIDTEVDEENQSVYVEANEETPTKRKHIDTEANEEEPKKRRNIGTDEESVDKHIQKNNVRSAGLKCNYRIGFESFLEEPKDARFFLKNHDFLNGIMHERYSLTPITDMKNSIFSGVDVIVPRAFFANPDTKEELLSFLDKVVSGGSPSASGVPASVYRLYSVLRNVQRRIIEYNEAERNSALQSLAQPNQFYVDVPMEVANNNYRGSDKKLQELITTYKSINENKPLCNSVLVVCRALVKTDDGLYACLEPNLQFDICEMTREKYKALCAVRLHNLQSKDNSAQRGRRLSRNRRMNSAQRGRRLSRNRRMNSARIKASKQKSKGKHEHELKEWEKRELDSIYLKAHSARSEGKPVPEVLEECPIDSVLLKAAPVLLFDQSGKCERVVDESELESIDGVEYGQIYKLRLSN